MTLLETKQKCSWLIHDTVCKAIENYVINDFSIWYLPTKPPKISYCREGSLSHLMLLLHEKINVIYWFLVYVVRFAIWYHLYNFKNVKNNHRGVLILVKLQALACNFTKINTSPWVIFTFSKLYKWYQIVQRTIDDIYYFWWCKFTPSKE